MKGFIFTIEGLLAIGILIILIIIILNNPNQFENSPPIKVYANGLNIIYFNETNQTIDFDNKFCEIFVKYDNGFEKIIYCEGYNE